MTLESDGLMLDHSQKPVVSFFTTDVVDLDDVDGMSMLNRSFVDCIVVKFSKPMNEEQPGTVSIDGKPLSKPGIFYTFMVGKGINLFGIPYGKELTEYGRSYILSFEGFQDREGTVMEPQELTVRTAAQLQPVPGYEEHDGIALQIAREGIVLLKNEEQLLPIAPAGTLNVFGKGLYHFRICATGAGKINPRYQVGLVKAIEQYSGFKLNQELAALYRSGQDVLPSAEVLENAYQQSDIAVITITRMSGENLDNSSAKGEYYLTDAEESMIREVSKKFTKVIAILNTGIPIDVSWVDKYNLKAVLYCAFPGMLGGQAVVEILDGRVNPSAKLPDTWALDYYDHPSSRNFYNAVNGNERLDTAALDFIDTYYEEGIYVGYRYFETFGKEVAYPFGHGLSYTTFAASFSDLQYNGSHITLNTKITNTGSVPGKEVVQVYVEEPDGKLEKPARKLVAFFKTKLLEPGEAQEAILCCDEQRLTSFDPDTSSWVLEQGKYVVWAGSSVKESSPAGSFEVLESRTIRTSAPLMQPPVDITSLSKKDPEGTYPAGNHSGVKPGVNEIEPKGYRRRYAEQPIQAELPQEVIKYTEVLRNPDLLGAFIKQMSVEELARLSVCASHGWGMHEKGEAGRVFLLPEYDMLDYTVADGNHGVNVKNPNIGLPSSVNLCSTFSTDLALQAGRVIAEEAREQGIHMILAPGMNLHRNPLNGRHPEYFSEDPYLTGMMAGYMSKGLEDNGVSSCLKHTIANNCESSRMRNQSMIPERALRELYLKAFEVAMEVHQPDAIMTAYNAVNGVFAAEDEEMIQGIFRGEFGFEGFVMTDWNSYHTINVASAVQAGNAWMTPGSIDDTYVAPIIEGVRSGQVERERLEKNIMGLIRVIMKQHRAKGETSI